MKKILGLLMCLTLVLCLGAVALAAEAEAKPCDHVWEIRYDTDQAVEPTCTEKGYGHHVCIYCGEEPDEDDDVDAYVNVDPLGHQPGEPEITEEVTLEPTCVAEGNKDVTTTVTCEREGCGEVLSTDVAHVVIPATGVHTWGEEPEVVPGTATEATCVEGGSYDVAIFCTVCGAEKEGTRETVTVDAQGHQPAEEPVEENIVPATCVKPGSKDMVTYCTVCHIELSRKTEVIPTIDHIAGTPVKENIIAPTCVDKGSYDLVTYCTMCGMEMSRENVVDETTPLKPHQWELDIDNPNYVAPTCYEEGLGYFFCTVCGAKNNDVPLEKVPHNYGPEVTVPATCMDKGGIIQECQNEGCTPAAEGHFNYVEVFEIDPNGHKWELADTDDGATPDTEGSVTRPATCTKFGVNAYVCAYNEMHRYAEQVPPLDHIYVQIPDIKPTCTDVGYTAGVVCIREGCDGEAEELPDGYPEENITDALPDGVTEYVVLKAPEVIDAKGHKVLDIITPDSATCTEDGEVTYKCAVCGEEVTEPTEAKGHSWVRSDAEDNPETCSTSGYISWRCENCGEEKREEIDPNGEHQFGDWITIEPTCKTAGRTYRVCEICGYEDNQDFYDVDENAHQWEVIWEDYQIIVDGAIVDVKSDIKTYPTCTENGFGKFRCNVCGKEKYDAIEAGGHNPIELPGVEPTCTTPGLSGGSYCEWCNEELEAQEVIPALGHDWEEKIITEATCTTKGEKALTCKRCGETTTEEIPAPGHGELVSIPAVPATTESTGLTEGWKCSVCGEVIIPQQVIEKLTEKKNGLCLDTDGKWKYFIEDEVDTTMTGIVDFEGGSFFVADGILCSDANGLNMYPEGTWYFLANGQIQKQYTGLALYDGEWFYIVNGRLDNSLYGLVDYSGTLGAGKFLVNEGMILRSANGLWMDNEGTWYYLQNGQVATWYNGPVSYQGGTFNVVNGIVK